MVEFLKHLIPALRLDEEEQRILEAIEKSGFTTMRVVGRGTLTVDPREITNSAEFKRYTEKARLLVEAEKRR